MEVKREGRNQVAWRPLSDISNREMRNKTPIQGCRSDRKGKIGGLAIRLGNEKGRKGRFLNEGGNNASSLSLRAEMVK
jgi:hypothetical protein